MKKIINLIVFVILNLVSLDGFSTHIVGGEISLQKTTVSGATHTLKLNLYFDALNGNSNANDEMVTLGFFRKRDNNLMGFVNLPKTSENNLKYPNPLCNQSIGLSTKLIEYSENIILEAQNFNDSQGYYIVWERCCRNKIITNIVSPDAAGTVFYLEFPPLVSNNNLINNSSPTFNALDGDFICINEFTEIDFSAKDIDGDSLVYSMQTPLNGFSSTDNPRKAPTGSSNYPKVTWAQGFNENNSILGNRPLNINPETGILSVQANAKGLYVFSIKVDEYRNGKKIGTVFREYQYKVIECPKNAPPQTKIKELGSNTFLDLSKTIILNASNKRCIQFYIADADSGQNINVSINPVNFLSSKYKISSASGTIKGGKDTLKAEVCFEECVATTDNKELVFDVLVTDNGCPVNTQRTRLKVDIVGTPNLAAIFNTGLVNSSIEIYGKDTLRFVSKATDKDNDLLTFKATGRGFDISKLGINYNAKSGNGNIESPFEWIVGCEDIRPEPYIIDLSLTERHCEKNIKYQQSITLNTLAKPNSQPKLSTNSKTQNFEILIDEKQLTPINFDITGKDNDKDFLKLYLEEKNINFSKESIKWQNKEGFENINSNFDWTPNCQNLNGKNERMFDFKFIIDDHSCSTNKYDTLSINVLLKNIKSEFKLNPPNVISPNNDNINDAFFINDLPADNCQEKFSYIKIFTRWGQEIFSSKDRDFKWEPNNTPIGTYLYNIKYTSKNYKGWIEVLK